ncbi:MAG: ribosome maturation factor RimM [Alphaproteobacteria bacterium]|nr:ribosome maturation factor RimM [Alphaproteobacteria bacterium]
MSENDKILVGKIVAPQGVRGEVRVQTYSESPNDFKQFKILSDKFESDYFKFVRPLSPKSTVIIARIDGVNTRNDAESFRGTELFIARDSLPQLKKGEYYQSDLIGFSVIRDGKQIGIVSGFQNFGAGDIIELDNGDMVSFVGAVVDFDKKNITVK